MPATCAGHDFALAAHKATPECLNLDDMLEVHFCESVLFLFNKARYTTAETGQGFKFFVILLLHIRTTKKIFWFFWSLRTLFFFYVGSWGLGKSTRSQSQTQQAS